MLGEEKGSQVSHHSASTLVDCRFWFIEGEEILKLKSMYSYYLSQKKFEDESDREERIKGQENGGEIVVEGEGERGEEGGLRRAQQDNSQILGKIRNVSKTVGKFVNFNLSSSDLDGIEGRICGVGTQRRYMVQRS